MPNEWRHARGTSRRNIAGSLCEPGAWNDDFVDGDARLAADGASAGADARMGEALLPDGAGGVMRNGLPAAPRHQAVPEPVPARHRRQVRVAGEGQILRPAGGFWGQVTSTVGNAGRSDLLLLRVLRDVAHARAGFRRARHVSAVSVHWRF